MKTLIVNLNNTTFNKITMICANMGIKPSEFTQQLFETPMFKQTLDIMWQALVKTSNIENENERKQAFFDELKNLMEENTNDK